MSHFLVRFHLNLFILSVFEKRLKGGSPLFSPFQNVQHHHNHEIKAVVSSRTAINTTFQNGRSSWPLPPAVSAGTATAAPWFGHPAQPSTTQPSTMRIQPLQFSLFSFEIAKTAHILPLSLPPIVDCASTNEAATTLEAITAATPILAFLIALNRLTFKEITAGMVER
jgi:hypothetical protein